MAKFRKDGIYGHRIKDVDLNTCYYCMTTVDEHSRTVDHLIPESRGGIRAKANIVPSCGDCNRLKANQTPEEFKKTVQSIMYYERVSYNKRKGYLSKVLKNISRLIDSKNGKKQ
jgi:hypothetical protein